MQKKTKALIDLINEQDLSPVQLNWIKLVLSRICDLLDEIEAEIALKKKFVNALITEIKDLIQKKSDIPF